MNADDICERQGPFHDGALTDFGPGRSMVFGKAVEARDRAAANQAARLAVP
jgi:hypothetical protein